MIKLIPQEKSYSAQFERCSYVIREVGTGIHTRPACTCRKRATVDFHGDRVCQQHAGTLALAQIWNDQNE